MTIDWRDSIVRKDLGSTNFFMSMPETKDAACYGIVADYGGNTRFPLVATERPPRSIRRIAAIRRECIANERSPLTPAHLRPSFGLRCEQAEQRLRSEETRAFLFTPRIGVQTHIRECFPKNTDSLDGPEKVTSTVDRITLVQFQVESFTSLLSLLVVTPAPINVYASASSRLDSGFHPNSLRSSEGFEQQT